MKTLIQTLLIASLLALPAIAMSKPSRIIERQAKNQARLIDLGTWPNWDNFFVNFPIGNTAFGSIPFYMRESNPAFIATGVDAPGRSDDVSIAIPPEKVRKVHLLFNGGNMYLDKLGVQVGYISLKGSKSSLDIPLVGGVNIREWSPYEPHRVINTLTDPNVREVWSGTWAGWLTVPARIDLYTIHVPRSLGALEFIELHDTDASAGLNLYAVTIQK